MGIEERDQLFADDGLWQLRSHEFSVCVVVILQAKDVTEFVSENGRESPMLPEAPGRRMHVGRKGTISTSFGCDVNEASTLELNFVVVRPVGKPH